MQFVSIPNSYRRNVSIAHVLKVTPPGDYDSSYFESIIPRLRKNAYGGEKVDIRPTKYVLLFRDVVGLIGDTPGINYLLDFSGSSETACCHICSLTKRARLAIGSR